MENRTSPANWTTMTLHPAEARLIQYIRTLGFGRIERLEVQDGLPVIAEEVKERVRFGQGQGARGGPPGARSP